MIGALTLSVTIGHVPAGPDLDVRLVRVLADPLRAAVVRAVAVEQPST